MSHDEDEHNRRLTKILGATEDLLDPLLALLSDQEAFLAVKKIRKYIDQVLYVKASSPYCEVYFENRKLNFDPRVAIKILDDYFDDTELLRIHQSYLVNPHKVNSASKRARDFVLHLDDHSRSTDLPIARNKLQHLREHYAAWFSNEL